MFRKYKKLCDICIDRFPFIFVDEYQDSQKEVIEILLVHLRQSNRNNIIGFFGDAMQSIYDNGIGGLDEYIGNEDRLVREVKKEQNRRNPQLVIDLANKLRTDGLTQRPSDDLTAPNMIEGVIKEGTIKFLYSLDPDLESARTYLKWDFSDSKKIKELNLTHNLIADKAGFSSLIEIYDKDQILAYKDRLKKHIKVNNIQDATLEGKTFGEVIAFLKEGKVGSDLNKVSPTNGMKKYIDEHPDLFGVAKNYEYTSFVKMYVNKDQLLDDKKQDVDDENKKGSKRDDLIKHLFKIQNNLHFYLNDDFNSFIKATDFHVGSIADKKKLRDNINNIVASGEKTIGEIITMMDEIGLCIIDDKVAHFKEKYEYIYNRVCSVKYREFQNLYSYLEGNTPFSTQHKTKGAEFSNVLIILDNGKWNKYNFENLFTESGNPSVLNRSQKIFYVCCTRAKENLAVFFHNPSSEVITKAEQWFGERNVINLDT